MLRKSNEPAVPYSEIGNFFGISKGTVQYHHSKGIVASGAGRPSLLNEFQKGQLIDQLNLSYYNALPMGYKDVQAYILREFNIESSIDTIRHFCRRLSDFKTVKGLRIDANKQIPDVEKINQYFSMLENNIPGIPDSFIANVDETGFQQSNEARDQMVLVPKDFTGEEIYFDVGKNGKKSTQIAGIFADGTALKPFIAVQSHTCIADVENIGINDDVARLVYQQTGFIDYDLFDKWANEIFFPEIERRRVQYDYTGDCLLIIDPCNVHASDDFMDQCTFRKIVLVFLAPYSSDQCQPLNLCVFNAQKKFKLDLTGYQELPYHSEKVLESVTSWNASATQPNILKSFELAGFLRIKGNDGKYYYSIKKELATKIRHLINGI